MASWINNLDLRTSFSMWLETNPWASIVVWTGLGNILLFIYS